MSMEYRKEIDGLRAIAVVSVILFHAGFSTWSGGFVGVDIFFVLSGYLISSIILRDLKQGTFSFAEFYQRRARRILPALFLVMLCCVPFAWLWIAPDGLEIFSKSLVSAAFSVSNFYFWKKSDYFAPDADTSPLLHTWSLGVEEQFYLLFPLLLVSLWLWRRRWIAPTIVLIALSSLLLSQWAAQNAPSANFYLLPTRAWELLAGSLVALWQFHTPGTPRSGNGALAIAGLALVIFSTFYFDEGTPFPSVYALAPIVGTALVLHFARAGTWAARLLSLPPLVGVGLISYSAYLWHQPVLAFLRLSSPSAPSTTALLAACTVTMAIACLSWRYVEQPFRKGRIAILRTPGRVAGAALATTLVITAAGLTGVYTDGMPGRLPPAVQNFMAEAKWSRNCLYQRGDEWKFPDSRCSFNGEKPTQYAIWGDSVSASITPVLAERLKREGIELHQLTHGYCAPILDVTPDSNESASPCPTFNASAYNYIIDSGIDTVVLFASWREFFRSEDYLVDGRTVSGVGHLKPELIDTLRGLDRAGVRIVIVYPHPTLAEKASDTVVKMMMRGEGTPDLEQDYAEFKRRAATSYAMLDAATHDTGLPLVRIYPEKVFCNVFEDGKCVMVNDGKPYIADRVHFTDDGAQLVVAQIMSALQAERSAHVQVPANAPTQ